MKIEFADLTLFESLALVQLLTAIREKRTFSFGVQAPPPAKTE